MANVPLTYKLSFYDPDIPTGVITVQENNANAAVRLDTQFSMQDLVDTVNNSEVSTASLVNETTEEIRAKIAPGSVRIIMPISLSDELNHWITVHNLPSIDGGTGVGLFNKRAKNSMYFGKAAIVNDTDYTMEQLFGSTPVPESWSTWERHGPGIYLPNNAETSPLVGLWKVTVNLELACMAINTIGAPISTQVWLEGATSGSWDDTGNLRNTAEAGTFAAVPPTTPWIDSDHRVTFIAGHVFEATTAQLMTQADVENYNYVWDATSVDLDVLVERIQNEVIVNTNTDNDFKLFIMSRGGTGAGPGGSPVVFTGIRKLFDQYQPKSGQASINGVPTFTGGFPNDLEHVHRGSAAGAGFISFEWMGEAWSTEEAASGYYYDGDAIGEENL